MSINLDTSDLSEAESDVVTSGSVKAPVTSGYYSSRRCSYRALLDKVSDDWGSTRRRYMRNKFGYTKII